MKKLGVIHYNTPYANLKDFLKWAADTGFEYVELMPPDVAIDEPDDAASLEQARQVRDLVKSYGLRVSALSAFNDFVVLDSQDIDFQVARMRNIAELTKIVDDEAVVRADGGWEKPGVPQDRWIDSMYECFSRCQNFIDRLAIDIAIDNHGTITNDGDLLLGLLRRLDHPRIGSNLDTMNLRWYGHDVAACNMFYQNLAPYVKHVHLKDGIGARDDYKGCALGDGEIDLNLALSSVQASGYTGAYAAEYEGTEIDNGVGYAKCLAWMRTHV